MTAKGVFCVIDDAVVHDTASNISPTGDGDIFHANWITDNLVSGQNGRLVHPCGLSLDDACEFILIGEPGGFRSRDKGRERHLSVGRQLQFVYVNNVRCKMQTVRTGQ